MGRHVERPSKAGCESTGGDCVGQDVREDRGIGMGVWLQPGPGRRTQCALPHSCQATRPSKRPWWTLMASAMAQIRRDGGWDPPWWTDGQRLRPGVEASARDRDVWTLHQPVTVSCSASCPARPGHPGHHRTTGAPLGTGRGGRGVHRRVSDGDRPPGPIPSATRPSMTCSVHGTGRPPGRRLRPPHPRSVPASPWGRERRNACWRHTRWVPLLAGLAGPERRTSGPQHATAVGASKRPVTGGRPLLEGRQVDPRLRRGGTPRSLAIPPTRAVGGGGFGPRRSRGLLLRVAQTRGS